MSERLGTLVNLRPTQQQPAAVQKKKNETPYMFQFLTTKYGVGQSESELDKLIGFLPFLPTRILSVF